MTRRSPHCQIYLPLKKTNERHVENLPEVGFNRNLEFLIHNPIAFPGSAREEKNLSKKQGRIHVINCGCNLEIPSHFK